MEYLTEDAVGRNLLVHGDTLVTILLLLLMLFDASNIILFCPILYQYSLDDSPRSLRYIEDYCF